MEKLIIKDRDIDLLEWRKFYDNSSNSSPFQTPEYYLRLRESKDVDTEVFGVVDSETNKLKALAVVTIFKEKGVLSKLTKRGIIFGGIVTTNELDLDAVFKLLQGMSMALKGKVIYIETRNFFDYTNLKETFQENKWEYSPHLNVLLNIENYTLDNIIKKFKYNRKRETLQTISSGVTWERCIDINGTRDFYEILKELYKERVKLPLPAFSFFEANYDTSFSKLFLVKYNNKIVGGSFCFFDKKKIYTMYYCGERGVSSKIFPTHIAVLAAIEFAINNNINQIDFMGAGLHDFEYGVRKYKLAFGGELIEHGRFRKVLNPFLYNIASLAIRYKKYIGFLYS